MRTSHSAAFLITTLLTSPAALAGGPVLPNLFFSEYVEGTSNNKAVEIYNAGADPVDLAAAQISVRIYANGSVTATSSINLTGTLAAGDAFVLANSSASFAASADQTSGAVSFNGDDAVVLVAAGTFLDVIGRIGEDPGVQWGTSPNDTLDQTLRRLATICVGDTVGSDVFDPSTEWESFPVDSFDGLGEHTADCGGTPCLADIAPQGGDGSVGVPDLLAIISGWGACGDPCPGDIAPPGGDGSIGVPDLLAVISNWGPCK